MSAEIVACRDKLRRQAMLRELFRGFEAVLEHPAGCCADDLVELYPEAKVFGHRPLKVLMAEIP